MAVEKNDGAFGAQPDAWAGASDAHLSHAASGSGFGAVGGCVPCAGVQGTPIPRSCKPGAGVRMVHGAGQDVIHVQSDSGEGTMTFFEVFPGVSLSYNDFHMDRYDSGFVVDGSVLCIDHCREGRIEQPVSGGAYSYVAAGDLKIDDRTRHTGEFVLPLAHYHGITVSFEIERAAASIEQALGGFPVDLRALRDRFCVGGDPLIMHDAPGVEHIFSELYSVPEEIRSTYFRIKVLELLLFLQVLEPNAKVERRPYFYRSQVEKVKAARDLMVSDLAVERTTEELAERFGLPLTAFKSCFRGVYGMPPYAYIRAYRMEHAASLLRDTDMRVADIGLVVGYDSPSKFTAAFRAVMGDTPTGYRRTRRR